MNINKKDFIEIVQQNRRGPGRMASRAWGLVAVLGFAVCFLLGISAYCIQRTVSGEGQIEEVVGLFLFPPAALVMLICALYELSLALPRRLHIDANGIHIRYGTWPLPRPKRLFRRPGQQAEVFKLRTSNYPTYPSGRMSHAPIISSRFVIRYGGGWFGPVDEDQAAPLAEAINTALERTGPTD